MIACARFPCGGHTGGCTFIDCINNQSGPSYLATPFNIPSPRHLPVNVPFSTFGVTVVTMDRDGNITIKLDQVIPEVQP
jgi:hypothetical protein